MGRHERVILLDELKRNLSYVRYALLNLKSLDQLRAEVETQLMKEAA